MKCPKCGAILEADSVFCVSCGASLSEIGEAASSTPGSTEHDNDVTPQKQGEHPQKESVSNKGKITCGKVHFFISIKNCEER